MSIDDIKWLENSSNPIFEIAGHGNNHKNDFEDITTGRKILLDWLGKSENLLIGFASPGSDMNENFINENADKLGNIGFSYIRTGLRIQSNTRLRVISRKIARIIHSPILFSYAYEDTLQNTIDGISVVSVPILHDTKLEQIKRLILTAEKKQSWLVLMFHSILNNTETFYSDTWAWDYGKFEELIKYLKDEQELNHLKVVTTIEGYNERKCQSVK